VNARYGYENLEDAVRREELDVLYVVVPNHRHRELTERAALAGAHVLCEKAMAVTEEECRSMIRAVDTAGVKLMIAYRLHFEEANLKALEIVRSGRIGEPRLVEAVFCNRVDDPNNTRLVAAERGGGPLYDVGIYCINAVRHVFDEEPSEAVAVAARGQLERFASCDEAVTAVLRFPGDRLAVVSASFGAADRDSYTIHGTEGHLRVEPAFTTTGTLRHHLQVANQTKERKFPSRDQVAPEILYFSDCILEDREPEPDGIEGLADVRVIEAVLRSAKERRAISIQRSEVGERPSMDQEDRRPPVPKQELVHVESPSG
jgi:glucose-fructose oxidoreductase